MAYDIGQGLISIVPSFAGVEQAISDEAAKWGESAGEIFGEAFAEAAKAATSDAIPGEDSDAAEKGTAAGGAFADAFRARVDAALQALPAADIRADDADVTAKLAEIRADLETLSSQRIGVDISDTDALAKLAELKLALEEIGHSSESISIKVDTAQASAELAAFSAESDVLGGTGGGGLATLGSDAESAGADIGSVLVPALALLATALIPIAGLAGGALAALPAIVSGGGLGLGALVLGFSGVIPAISAYNATLNTAGETAAQVKTKQDALTNALAGLSPAGRSFVAFVGGELLPMFDKLKSSVQSVLLPGITTGLQAMLPFFQSLQPFIVAAAQGIGETVTQLGRFLGSATGLRETNAIFAEGNGLMSKLGDAAVTLFEAFTSIGSKAGPIVSAIGDGIEHLVDSFAKWAEGGGFQKFLAWVVQNGPGIVGDIANVAKAIGGLVVLLAPLGKLILDVVSGVVKFVAGLIEGNPVMDKLVLALGAAAAGFFVLNAALDADPIVLIIGAVVALGFAIEELVTHWSAVWKEIKELFNDAVSFLRSGFGTLVVLLLGPLAPMVLIALHWQQLWDGIKRVLHDGLDFFTQTIPHAFDDVVGWFAQLPGRAAKALGDILGTVFDALKNVGTWLENNVFIPLHVWFAQLPGRVANIIGDFFSVAWAALKNVGTWLENNVFIPLHVWFAQLPGRVAGFLGDFLGTALHDLTTVGSWLENNVWQPISGFFSGLGSRISTVAGHIWDGLKEAFISVANDIIAAWNDTFGKIHFSLPSWIPGIGGDSFGFPTISPIARAAGGPADAGVPYLVGELGPELFTPNVSGTISTNLSVTAAASALAGGSSQPVGGPVMQVGEQHFHDEASIEGLMRQASFFRKARRL